MGTPEQIQMLSYDDDDDGDDMTRHSVDIIEEYNFTTSYL